MSALTLERCLHHHEREAVARCPECRRFFCRECVIEHEERVICAGCLARMAAVPATPRRVRLLAATPLVSGVSGIFIAWLVFYIMGRMLLAIPADFHASKLWKEDWMRAGETP
jgi:hypothetical protein